MVFCAQVTPAVQDLVLAIRVLQELGGECSGSLETNDVQVDTGPELRQTVAKVSVLPEQRVGFGRIRAPERRNERVLFRFEMGQEPSFEQSPKSLNVFAVICLERRNEAFEERVEAPVVG